MKIPRVTDQQIEAANGTTVRRGELLPGDLVFFRDASGYVHHVGISMGGDKFLHAPHTGDVVKVSSLDEPYYKAQFTGGRRFDQAATGRAAPAPPAAAPAAARARRRGPGDRPRRGGRRPGGRRARRRRGAPVGQRAVQGDRHAGGAQPRASASARAATARWRAPTAARRGPARGGSAIFLQAITPEQAAAAAAAARPAAPARARGAGARRPRRRPRPPRPAAPAAPRPPRSPTARRPTSADVPADYPGDDAGQEELAKWLAKQAEKAGLPPELPVMAALVESGVKNLNFGDADSVGFFQMRVGIWNKGEYAGYPENPGLQAKWFIDTALAHKKAMIAQGDKDFGKDPRTWGEWIADVERPAEQYRGRYQLRLEEARKLLR